MTAIRLQTLRIPACEEGIERTYFDWGRGRAEDSKEPNWFRASAEQREAIARRGYALYDGLPQRGGDRVDQVDAYASIGIGSNVVVNDAVRFLVRADAVTMYLAKIPDDALLEHGTDNQIEALAALLDLFSDAYRVKWGKVTKVLHKKRPGFVPILDSVVVDFLWSSSPKLTGGYDRQNAEAIVRRFRDLLRAQVEPLEKVRAALESRGFRLGTVRLLDYLIWIGTSTFRRRPQFFEGCLLGGAVGDALGASVELMALSDIRKRYGTGGIRDMPAKGPITGNTQMTLFTAEGLLRADNRNGAKGLCHPPTMLHHAYLRWLETQGEQPPYPDPEVRDGWLLALPVLRARRSPGDTCLSALRTGRMGTIEKPINDSKGCGGVMRVAPVGLLGHEPFSLGCEAAAISHGHPTGFLAAGFLAAVLAAIIDGAYLDQAIATAVDELRRRPNHEECLRSVETAVQLAKTARITSETVEELGAGWLAEEALAIALFCSLTADSFESGVTLAVNHGGNSTSTGAMTGHLLGALLGKDAVPKRWLQHLELRDVLGAIATDLYRHFGRDASNKQVIAGADIQAIMEAGLAPQMGVGDAHVSAETDWRRYPG